MHFCKAAIALSGDRDQTYYADQHAPVSWPEIQVIQFIHGDDSVSEVVPFVSIKQTARAERQRLSEKYGEEKVAAVFPRAGPSELEAPDATIVEGVLWKNPISGTLETVEAPKGKAKAEPEPEPEPEEDEPAPVKKAPPKKG